MAQENAWGPINVIRVHKCSLKLMWCSWRCSDDVKDTHNRKEWAGNPLAPFRACVPVIRKKHSGVSLVLSSATSDVSFREKGIRPLGCGYKEQEGLAPPPGVCGKWWVSGDGLSPNPVLEPSMSWESLSYEGWDSMGCGVTKNLGSKGLWRGVDMCREVRIRGRRLRQAREQCIWGAQGQKPERS